MLTETESVTTSIWILNKIRIYDSACREGNRSSGPEWISDFEMPTSTSTMGLVFLEKKFNIELFFFLALIFERSINWRWMTNYNYNLLIDNLKY